MATTRLKRILFVPDTHRPYHDVAAWRLMLKAGRAFEPDRVVVLGDFADAYSVSAHVKDPTRRANFADELADVNRGLDELEALKADAFDFVEGNHEYRLPRYLQGVAPALAAMDTLTIPALFNLKSRGWRFTPYREHLELGKLYVTHDTGNAGADAHRKAQQDFNDNVLIAHTHRIGFAVVGNAKGKPHVGAMFGWLGGLKHIDYCHRIRALRDWSHGFGIGFLEPSGVIHLQPIPIVEGRCVIAGELIRG